MSAPPEVPEGLALCPGMEWRGDGEVEDEDVLSSRGGPARRVPEAPGEKE